MLAAEKKALGFYITGHPLDSHAEAIAKVGSVSSAQLSSLETGSRVTVAGLVTDLQLRTTKRGDRFAIFRLEDQAGSTKCVLWPEAFNRNGALIPSEATILTNGKLEVSDEGAVTLIVERVTGLDDAVQEKARELVIRFPVDAESEDLQRAVRDLLEQSQGDSEVFIELVTDELLVRLRAHPSLRVKGSAALDAALRQLGCEVRWEGHAYATRAASVTALG